MAGGSLPFDDANLLEKCVDGGWFEHASGVGWGGEDRAELHSAAVEQCDGVSAGRAVMVAVDQAADGVLQARGGLAVDAELDWFG